MSDPRYMQDVAEIDSLRGAINIAAGGYRGEDQQRIAQVGIAWLAKLLSKNSDYGSSAWQTPILAPECEPGVAIRVRMSDKIARLQRLLSHSAEVPAESIDDTLDDLAGYCLLLRALPQKAGEPVFPGHEEEP